MVGGDFDARVSLISVCSILSITVPISDTESAIPVKGPLFKSSNRFLDVLVCGEELGFHELNGGVEFSDCSQVTLAKVFDTIGCVSDFFGEVGYLDLESVYIG